MSANFKASINGKQAIIGVGGVDQMTVSNLGVVTANSFIGSITGTGTFSGNASGATALSTGSTVTRAMENRFADVVNVKDFGAVGTGLVDDQPSVQLAIDYAISKGVGVYFPTGTYLINSSFSDRWALYADCVTNKTFSITLENDVIIKAGIALNSTLTYDGSKAIIRIDNTQFSPSNESESVSEASQKICIYGGEINLESITPQTTKGIDGISIGASSRKIEIASMLFNHGITAPLASSIGYGGGDSGLFVKEPLSLNVTNCRFVGSPDIGIYISGDPSDNTDIPYRRGKQAMINGCSFYRCGNGIAQKRFFEQCIISSNHFYECGNGILFGSADTGDENTGDRTIISGNYIRKTQGNPISLSYSKNININGNTILDYRKWISDGTTDTVVSTFNYGGGVKVDEVSSNVLITGNILGFDEWIGYVIIPATSLQTGKYYRIEVIGTTNWSSIGISGSASVGDVFQKNSTPATGNGTAGVYPSNYGVSIKNNSLNVHVTGNMIKNAYRPIISENNCSSITFIANKCFSNTNDNGEMFSNRNYVNFLPSDSISGGAPTVKPEGIDSISTDLILKGNGTGLLKFGTYTVGSTTPVGYINIKSTNSVGAEVTLRIPALIAP